MYSVVTSGCVLSTVFPCAPRVAGGSRSLFSLVCVYMCVCVCCIYRAGGLISLCAPLSKQKPPLLLLQLRLLLRLLLISLQTDVIKHQKQSYAAVLSGVLTVPSPAAAAATLQPTLLLQLMATPVLMLERGCSATDGVSWKQLCLLVIWTAAAVYPPNA